MERLSASRENSTDYTEAPHDPPLTATHRAAVERASELREEHEVREAMRKDLESDPVLAAAVNHIRGRCDWMEEE